MSLPGTDSARGGAHGKQSIDLVGVNVIDEAGSTASESWESQGILGATEFNKL